jgi:arylsulfatase A
MVEYLDWQVGDLLDVLERQELSRDTLVIFVADNGSHVALRGRRHDVEIQGAKGSTLDAGTHVPLLIRWPAALAPAKVSSDMVDLVDLFATIAAAADQRREAAASDGHDLLPRLQSGAPWPRDAIFMDYALGWWPLGAVRYAFTDRWKLYGDGRFFDTNADPLEKAPLAAGSHDEEARAARQRLESVLGSVDYRPLTLADRHFPDGFDPARIDYAAVTEQLVSANRRCGDPSRAPSAATKVDQVDDRPSSRSRAEPK